METYSIFFIVFFVLLIISLTSIYYYHKKKSDTLKILYCSTGFLSALFFLSSVGLYFQKKPVQTTISQNTIEPTVIPVTDEKFIHSEVFSENYQDQEEEIYDY